MYRKSYLPCWNAGASLICLVGMLAQDHHQETDFGSGGGTLLSERQSP
jgi:hypothetical protein